MQPVRNSDFSTTNDYGNDKPYVNDKPVVNQKNDLNILPTDDEIDSMSTEKLKHLCKNQKYYVIYKNSKNVQLEEELEATRAMAKKSLQDLSTVHSVANLQANKDNRRDFSQMNTQNFVCTAGRIVSFLATLAGIIITIVCLVL